MTQLIDYLKTAAEAVKAMLGLEKFINESGLEKLLIELVSCVHHKLMAVQLLPSIAGIDCPLALLNHPNN